MLPLLIPSVEVLNDTEYGEIFNFRPKSPFISETIRDRLMVAVEQ